MPSLKARIAGTITGTLTSARLRGARRRIAAWQRTARGGKPLIRYFHDPADPYSHLTVQLLPALAYRYNVTIKPHLVPPPDAAAAPDAARLAAWSRRDAEILAAAYHLEFPPDAAAPDAAALHGVTAVLAKALPTPSFAQTATQGGAALWRGTAKAWLAENLPATDAETERALADGGAERARLRHYLGGTFYFESEWFWGIDRLHHLETRLAAMGFDTQPGTPRLAPVRDVTLAGQAGSGAGRELHMFLSFRSPYSYIALPRACALARHYGASLRLRFVLPMVMRGLPVPGPKRFYIMLDTKREAERLGLPFGKIVDPVGPGVERGLAVLHHAIQAGMGEAFALSFLQGVFADGIDSASDTGLQEIASRAGLNDAHIRAALADQSWRQVAETNRNEMLAAGLWGVPSFKVDNGPMIWGQDRLWVIEPQLQR